MRKLLGAFVATVGSGFLAGWAIANPTVIYDPAVAHDTSCEPSFRGGDCHHYCLDLWTEYCHTRTPGQHAVSPRHGSCGLLDHLRLGCHGCGRNHCGGCAACNRGCASGQCQSTSKQTTSGPPQPTPQPAAPHVPDEPPAEPAIPEPAAETAPVRTVAPAVEVPSAVDEIEPPAAPEAPPLPSILPKDTPSIPINSVPPVPRNAAPVDTEPSVVPPVPEPAVPESTETELPQNVLPAGVDDVETPPLPPSALRKTFVRPASSGTARLLRQLDSLSR